MAEKKTFKFSYVLNPELCMTCGTCEAECRNDGIYISEGVSYAINTDNCIRCGRCFRACPADAITKVDNAA